MIRTLGRRLSHFAHRWVPDPFAIALLLTLVTIGLAALASEASLADSVGYWGGRLKGDTLLAKESGLWKLLTFAMQMCLILLVLDISKLTRRVQVLAMQRKSTHLLEH